jgi:L-lysine exporter family protein LysE/ArgO
MGVSGEGTSLKKAVAACLAFTFLNPHVYLDTVVMLGILGASAGAHRWTFATGAMTASVLWFPALAFLGARLAPQLARPRVWQVLGVVIALVMIVLAGVLAFAPIG